MNAWHMVQRRARRAGLDIHVNNHTFRATGITTYLMNGAQLYADDAALRPTKGS